MHMHCRMTSSPARWILVASLSTLGLALIGCGADASGALEEGAPQGVGPSGGGVDAAAPPPQQPPAPTFGGDAGTGGDAASAVPELCNGLDDNGDGRVDEGCSCKAGETQKCYPGPSEVIGKGACKQGTQTCVVQGEFAAWGACTGAVLPATETCNNVDDDCNGKVDDAKESCVIDVPVNIDGDCVTTQCPSNAPYPVGCSLTFSGGDDRGCVANVPNQRVVFLKEGDNCGAGHVSGKLKCSSKPGSGLNASNCPINKSSKYYPSSSGGCPD